MPIYTVQGPDGKTYEIEGPAGATAEQLAQVITGGAPKAAPAEQPTFGQMFQKELKGSPLNPMNWAGGAVRGAGDIGATLIRPFESGEENQQRRQAMTGALESLGADPNSMTFGATRLGANIAGTSGVGGLLGGAAAKLGAPNALVQALSSSGMNAGGATGLPGMAARVAGGAATGGASAGLIDQTSAGTGAAIGGGIPLVGKLAGAAGGALGNMLPSQVPPVTKETATAAQKAIQAGVTLPPSMVDPSVKNRVLESISGKQATEQIASARNQALAADAVRKDLGIAQNVPLNFAATKNLRDTMVQTGYEPLRQVGAIPASPSFAAKLDAIAKPYATPSIPSAARPDILKLVQENKGVQAFDSGDAIDAIRNLRAMADTAYAGGDKALGAAYKGVANAYESAIDDALSASGQQQLLTAFREARQKIAQTFTADKALREGGGTVDARVFGNMIQRQKPVSGAMREIGEAANVFPRAFLTPQQVGSPDTHNLKSIFSMGGSGAGATLGGLLGGPPGAAVGAALAAPVPFVAPALARKMILSPAAQQEMAQRVMQSTAQTPQNAALINALRQAMPVTYQTAPLLATN